MASGLANHIAIAHVLIKEGLILAETPQADVYRNILAVHFYGRRHRDLTSEEKKAIEDFLKYKERFVEAVRQKNWDAIEQGTF